METESSPAVPMEAKSDPPAAPVAEAAPEQNHLCQNQFKPTCASCHCVTLAEQIGNICCVPNPEGSNMLILQQTTETSYPSFSEQF